MNAPAPCCYSFGSFHLDPLRGKLTDGSRPIELRPKSLAVLQQLVANPQRLLIKDELLSAVWGQVVVTEDSLVQCVREIRQALGDEDQHLIRTIPRSGYMFVAAVAQEPVLFDLPAPPDGPRPVHTTAWRERVATIAGKRFAFAALIACVAIAAIVWLSLATHRDRQAADANGGAASKSRVSIAVLPLANIGQDPEQELFADGLTTDLLYLYFRDRQAQKLLRVPNNASAIPVQDMAATGIEVTQGLHIVEGIEDAATHAAVAGFGCAVGQGWYFGKPMNGDQATALLRSRQSAPEAVPPAYRNAAS